MMRSPRSNAALTEDEPMSMPRVVMYCPLSLRERAGVRGLGHETLSTATPPHPNPLPEGEGTRGGSLDDLLRPDGRMSRGFMRRLAGGPVGVEHARLVGPLVRVGAEEVALGLDQVRGQPLAAVAVEVREAGAERRERDALRNSE